MATALFPLPPLVPSYEAGWADSAGISEYEDLYDMLLAAYVPALGVFGNKILVDSTGRLPAADLQNTTGQPSEWVVGDNVRLPGMAVELDGSNDHYAGPLGVFFGLPAVSVAVWVRFDTLAGLDGLCSQFRAGAQGLLFRTSGVNLQFFTVTSSQVGGTFTTLTTNVWFFLVATYDGAIMRVYVNGQAVATTFSQTGTLGSSSTDGPMNLGGGAAGVPANSSEGDLDGQLGSVMVFQGGLTPSQVDLLWQIPQAPLMRKRSVVFGAGAAVTAAISGTTTTGIDEDDMRATAQQFRFAGDGFIDIPGVAWDASLASRTTYRVEITSAAAHNDVWGANDANHYGRMRTAQDFRTFRGGSGVNLTTISWVLGTLYGVVEAVVPPGTIDVEFTPIVPPSAPFSQSTTGIGATGATTNGRLAHRSGGGSTNITGVLQDFKIFDASGTLIHFWVISEGSGTVIADLVGGATGTLTPGTGAWETRAIGGGQTTIITLVGDTWVAAGATFDAQRQAIIDGCTSAQSELLGWNNEVRDIALVAAVVRESDTQVTITWDPAQTTNYDITAQETIEVTVPAAALVSSLISVVATPTFTVDAVAAVGVVRPVEAFRGGALAMQGGIG